MFPGPTAPTVGVAVWLTVLTTVVTPGVEVLVIGVGVSDGPPGVVVGVSDGAMASVGVVVNPGVTVTVTVIPVVGVNVIDLVGVGVTFVVTIGVGVFVGVVGVWQVVAK